MSGYRSRSAYKLMEIIKKFGLLNTKDNVLDLGSSPGGWSVKMYGDGVRVDIAPMEEGKVTFADGEVQELTISDEDKKFKPGVYKQNRMFVDACLNNGKVSYPAATLEDSLKVMEFIEDII